jgi:hypothetical protein
MVYVARETLAVVVRITPIRHYKRRIGVMIAPIRRVYAKHHRTLPHRVNGVRVARRGCPLRKHEGGSPFGAPTEGEQKMANKIAEGEGGMSVAPFFANLLSSQKDPAQLAAGGNPKPAPTYHCLDSECTKKYPSDDDESTTWLGDSDG